MSTAIEIRPATMFTLFFWWIDCDAEISLDEVIAQVDHEKLRKCNFVMFCWPKKVFLVCTYTVYSTDSTMLGFQMRILMAKLNIKATYDNFPPPSIYILNSKTHSLTLILCQKDRTWVCQQAIDTCSFFGHYSTLEWVEH